MIRTALLSCALLLSFTTASAAPADVEPTQVALARLQGYTDTLIDQCEQAGADADWLCAQSVRELHQLALNLQDVCGGDTSADCNELDQELSRIRGFVAYRRDLQN
jgi:hypothetical protein